MKAKKPQPLAQCIAIWLSQDPRFRKNALMCMAIALLFIILAGVGALFAFKMVTHQDAEVRVLASARRLARESAAGISTSVLARSGQRATMASSFHTDPSSPQEILAATRQAVAQLQSLKLPNGMTDHVAAASSAVGNWEKAITALEAQADEKNRQEFARTVEVGTAALHQIASVFEKERGLMEERLDHVKFISLVATLALLGLATVLTMTGGGLILKALWRSTESQKAAETQAQAVLGSTLDGVVTVDHSGCVISMNGAAERIFGIRSTEIMNRSVAKLIPNMTDSLIASWAGGAPQRVVGMRHSVPVHLDLGVTPVRMDRQSRYLLLVRTAHESGEEALRTLSMTFSGSTGEQFLNSLIEQLSKTLEMEYAFVLELPPARSARSPVLTLAERGRLHSSGHFEVARTAIEDTINGGERHFASGVADRFPGDRLLTALHAQSFLAMTLKDHAGEPLGVLGVFDKTPREQAFVAQATLKIFASRASAEIERKRFENQLAGEKETLATILRSIGEGFIAIDNDGCVLLMNSVAETLTGWTLNQAYGHQLRDVMLLLDRRKRESCEHAYHEIVESGRAAEASAPTIMESRSGAERLVETIASVINDSEGNKAGVVVLFRDVTEQQKQLEERMKTEKLESLGVAAGGIAHDFNNLLTGILGNISFALFNGDIDTETMERLNAAKKATTRAQELSQQLLTFAKGGAPVKQAACISQLVRDTVSFSLRGSHVRAEFYIPEELWSAEIDHGQVSQVLQNLTLNANQAMPGGGVVRVACRNIILDSSDRRALAPGKYVEIEVSDTGCGIPREALGKIFDPYFTTKPKGSGLGLATAYSIIKNHFGFVDVESEVGHGTTFTIILPATEKKSMKAADSVARPARIRTADRNARILVLDDEDFICDLIVCALKPLGYQVTTANDPDTAIEEYAKAMASGLPFDVVVSDLTIPGYMSGAEAVMKLRDMDPGVRAIVSSGYSNDPIMANYAAHGFCAILPKPYEPNDLADVIGKVLAETPQRQPEVIESTEEPSMVRIA